jgi:predicted nucleotide-binding protein (sugar kinase/HSP70/actin superfamily)
MKNMFLWTILAASALTDSSASATSVSQPAIEEAVHLACPTFSDVQRRINAKIAAGDMIGAKKILELYVSELPIETIMDRLNHMDTLPEPERVAVEDARSKLNAQRRDLIAKRDIALKNKCGDVAERINKQIFLLEHEYTKLIDNSK